MTTPTRKLPTPQEFATLSRTRQLDLLRRASSRQKLLLLVDAGDGEELLALLPPQDVYLLARELGPDQIPELLTMASPEQWTAFFDFDCWHGDTFNAAAARRWLAILLEGEAPRVAATLQQVDFELLVLMLHREVKVPSGPEELDDEDVMAEGRRRECGYLLDYLDEDGAKLYGTLIDILFREAPGFCRYLLEAVRSEGESLLQESVYRQRADRLLDQGLPDSYSAQAVFAWLDPATFTVAAQGKLPLGGSATGAAPGAALQLARPGGVLAEVLAEGIDAELTWELACLVNKVLMAERVDLGALDQVRAAVERTFAILNLGLEQLGGDDVEAARRHLHDAYAEQLFRLGFSLTLRLQRQARALQEASIGPYLDRPFRVVIDALLQRRPHFPVTLAEPGRSGLRPFGSRRDLRLVEAALDRLEQQRQLFETALHFELPLPEAWQLEGCYPRHGSELTLAAIFLTALANRLLGRAFAPQPLAAAELPALQALISRDGQLDPQLRLQTVAWLDELVPGAGAFGTFCLDLWNEEFCAVQGGELDPRYLGGLIVRLAGE
jgi:hypothetical protein